MSDEQIKERCQRAMQYFEHGYNCSQSVVAACADLYGLSEEMALRVSASFGGGIGRMRLTCGTACGMFILAGLENGNVEPDKPQNKLVNYELVRRLAVAFEQQHGSLVCAELLGMNGQPPKQKMPCKQMVGAAVELYLKTINNEKK